VKRDLKDWRITNELALDRREWKLVIHVPEPWSSVPSFYCFLLSIFPCPFFTFWLSVLLSFLLFYLVFYSLLFSPSFCSCFVPFFAHVVVVVENVEDNDESINQFEDIPLFVNPINIKHIEREFDKNLMPYMWKGENGKVVWKLCIIFHINVGIYLYRFEFISSNIICPICEKVRQNWKICMKNMDFWICII
jgi:hypothetical protein